jgi:hypothetical protein
MRPNHSANKRAGRCGTIASRRVPFQEKRYRRRMLGRHCDRRCSPAVQGRRRPRHGGRRAAKRARAGRRHNAGVRLAVPAAAGSRVLQAEIADAQQATSLVMNGAPVKRPTPRCSRSRSSNLSASNRSADWIGIPDPGRLGHQAPRQLRQQPDLDAVGHAEGEGPLGLSRAEVLVLQQRRPRRRTGRPGPGLES